MSKALYNVGLFRLFLLSLHKLKNMKLLKSIDLNDIVFIDIETVRIENELKKGTPLYDSWEYKLRYAKETDKFEDKSIEDIFKDKAALYAEFAKIVCITIGKIQDNTLKIKSFSSLDEKELLLNFSRAIDAIISSNKKSILCGHAIKGFDVPFIMRRCLINRIDVPTLVDTSTAKPWDLPLLDTLELWKGSGFYGASLLNVTTAFGIESSKIDMDGSETSDIFYNDKNGLDKIKNYCENDVFAVANLVRAMRGEDNVERDTSDMKIKKVGSLEKIFNAQKASKEEEKKLAEIIKNLPENQKKAAQDILEVTMPKK